MPNILTDADKALENCRLYAARHRNEEWAKTILRFCAEAGVTGSPLRALPAQVEQEAEPVAWRYSVQPQVLGPAVWAFSETKDVEDAQPLYASPTPAAPAAPEQDWTCASSPPPDGMPVLVRWPNSNPEADAPWRYAVARYEAKRAIHHWWSAESGVPRSFVVAPSDWRIVP